jgi:hypothetical protein
MSIKYLCSPDTTPVTIPTSGQNITPPETIVIVLTFTNDPSTSTPV